MTDEDVDMTDRTTTTSPHAGLAGRAAAAMNAARRPKPFPRSVEDAEPHEATADASPVVDEAVLDRDAVAENDAVVVVDDASVDDEAVVDEAVVDEAVVDEAVVNDTVVDEPVVGEDLGDSGGDTADLDPRVERRGRRLAARRHAPRRPVLKIAGWVVAGLLVAALVAVNLALYVANKNASEAERAGHAAVASATQRMPAILSYSYQTIDRDVAAAVSNLTGSFKSDYQSLLNSAVKPVAVEKKIVTKAEVVGASIVIRHATSAAVLVFVNQTTTSGASKTPQIDGSRIRVGLSKVGGQWLISSITPV